MRRIEYVVHSQGQSENFYWERRWHWQLEFKIRDMWVGVFWHAVEPDKSMVKGSKTPRDVDIWVCIIPCLPIHFWAYWKRTY